MHITDLSFITPQLPTTIKEVDKEKGVALVAIDFDSDTQVIVRLNRSDTTASLPNKEWDSLMTVDKNPVERHVGISTIADEKLVGSGKLAVLEVQIAPWLFHPVAEARL